MCEALQPEVESIIQNNPIVIFSKSYCPYCKRAKGLIEKEGFQYLAIELDQRPDGQRIQELLQQMTGQRTVPSVWVHGKFIGGSDTVANLQSTGELRALLAGGKDL